MTEIITPFGMEKYRETRVRGNSVLAATNRTPVKILIHWSVTRHPAPAQGFRDQSGEMINTGTIKSSNLGNCQSIFPFYSDLQ